MQLYVPTCASSVCVAVNLTTNSFQYDNSLKFVPGLLLGGEGCMCAIWCIVHCHCNLPLADLDGIAVHSDD